jgi:hypothetical protein
MRLWAEQVSMMHWHREKNPGEGDEHQDENHQDKASGKPPNDEPESPGNTEIDVDQCEH